MNWNADDGQGAATDPGATPESLRHLAATRPELRAAIASNPATDEALLAWLGSLGDPAIQAALDARRSPRPENGPWPQPALASGAGNGAPQGAPPKRRWIAVTAALVGVVILAGGLAFGLSGAFRAEPPAVAKPKAVPAAETAAPSAVPEPVAPPAPQASADPFAQWTSDSAPSPNAAGVQVSPARTFPDPDRSLWTEDFPHRFHYWMTGDYDRTPSSNYVSAAFTGVPEVIMPLSMALTCVDSNPIRCGDETESITITTGTTQTADGFLTTKEEECRFRSGGVALDTGSHLYSFGPDEFSLSVYQCELPAEGTTWREYFLYRTGDLYNADGAKFLQMRDEWETDGESLDGWETQQLAYTVMTSWVYATF